MKKMFFKLVNILVTYVFLCSNTIMAMPDYKLAAAHDPGVEARAIADMPGIGNLLVGGKRLRDWELASGERIDSVASVVKNFDELDRLGIMVLPLRDKGGRIARYLFSDDGWILRITESGEEVNDGLYDLLQKEGIKGLGDTSGVDWYHITEDRIIDLINSFIGPLSSKRWVVRRGSAVSDYYVEPVVLSEAEEDARSEYLVTAEQMFRLVDAFIEKGDSKRQQLEYALNTIPEDKDYLVMLKKVIRALYNESRMPGREGMRDFIADLLCRTEFLKDNSKGVRVFVTQRNRLNGAQMLRFPPDSTHRTPTVAMDSDFLNALNTAKTLDIPGLSKQELEKVIDYMFFERFVVHELSHSDTYKVMREDEMRVLEIEKQFYDNVTVHLGLPTNINRLIQYLKRNRPDLKARITAGNRYEAIASGKLGEFLDKVYPDNARVTTQLFAERYVLDEYDGIEPDVLRQMRAGGRLRPSIHSSRIEIDSLVPDKYLPDVRKAVESLIADPNSVTFTMLLGGIAGRMKKEPPGTPAKEVLRRYIEYLRKNGIDPVDWLKRRGVSITAPEGSDKLLAQFALELPSKGLIPIGFDESGRPITKVGEFLIGIKKLQEYLTRIASENGIYKPIKLKVDLFCNEESRDSVLDWDLKTHRYYGLDPDQINLWVLDVNYGFVPREEDVRRYPENFRGEESETYREALEYARGHAGEVIDQVRVPWGHGEFLIQMISSGHIIELIKRRSNANFVRNVDNTGAKVDWMWLAEYGRALTLREGNSNIGLALEVSERPLGPAGVGGGYFKMMLPSGEGRNVILEDSILRQIRRISRSRDIPRLEKDGYRAVDDLTVLQDILPKGVVTSRKRYITKEEVISCVEEYRKKPPLDKQIEVYYNQDKPEGQKIVVYEQLVDRSSYYINNAVGTLFWDMVLKDLFDSSVEEIMRTTRISPIDRMAELRRIAERGRKKAHLIFEPKMERVDGRSVPYVRPEGNMWDLLKTVGVIVFGVDSLPSAEKKAEADLQNREALLRNGRFYPVKVWDDSDLYFSNGLNQLLLGHILYGDNLLFPHRDIRLRASSLSVAPEKLRKREVRYYKVNVDINGDVLEDTAIVEQVDEESREKFGRLFSLEKLRTMLKYLRTVDSGCLVPIEEVVLVDNLGGIDSEIPDEQKGAVAYIRGKQMVIDIDVFGDETLWALKDTGTHEMYEKDLELVEENAGIQEVAATFLALKVLLAQTNYGDLRNYIAFLRRAGTGLDSKYYADLLEHVNNDRDALKRDDRALIALAIGYVLNTERYEHPREKLQGIVAGDVEEAVAKLDLAKGIYLEILRARGERERLKEVLEPVIDRVSISAVKVKILQKVKMVANRLAVAEVDLIDRMLGSNKFLEFDIDKIGDNKVLIDWITRVSNKRDESPFVFFSGTGQDVGQYLRDKFGDSSGKFISANRRMNDLLTNQRIQPDKDVIRLTDIIDGQGALRRDSLNLPFLYSVTGVYLAAEIVIASGNFEQIGDPLVRNTLKAIFQPLFDEPLSSDDDWRLLFLGLRWPPIERITATIDALRIQIKEIEKAA